MKSVELITHGGGLANRHPLSQCDFSHNPACDFGD
jgi:hypothetical protein